MREREREGNEKRRRANRQEKESVEGQIANSRITNVSILVSFAPVTTTFALLLLILSEILDSTLSTPYSLLFSSTLSTPPMFRDPMLKVLDSKPTPYTVCMSVWSTV